MYKITWYCNEVAELSSDIIFWKYKIFECNTNLFNYFNIQISLSEYSIFILSLWMYIWCIFGIDLINMRQIFGIYFNIKHRIFNIWIWILYFIGRNIFGIHIHIINIFIFGPRFNMHVSLESIQNNKHQYPAGVVEINAYLGDTQHGGQTHRGV